MGYCGRCLAWVLDSASGEGRHTAKADQRRVLIHSKPQNGGCAVTAASRSCLVDYVAGTDSDLKSALFPVSCFCQRI